eukprot:2689433-Rhodomonas_salina.1
MPGEFVLDLGGFADVVAVTVRNTRNGWSRDRGTKDFRVEVRARAHCLEWTQGSPFEDGARAH